MRKQIITMSGLPGSGKSSTAKGVAQELGYRHFSSGDIFRKMGQDMGLSVEQANLKAESQKEIDFRTDEYIRELGKSQNEFVLDSRIAFHWIPDSFKVFLSLDPQISAERVFNQIQKEGRLNQTGSSIVEIYKNTLARIESEQKRYANLYQIDFTDRANYDFFVDTSQYNLTEVIVMVTQAYRKWLNED